VTADPALGRETSYAPFWLLPKERRGVR